MMMQLSSKSRMLIVVAAGLALALVPAFTTRVPAVETNVLVRDPSTIIKRGKTYWVYGTGRGGGQQFSSTDRVHWRPQGPFLPEEPAFVAQAAPRNTTNSIWAPDVHEWGGKYYLYYSYSEIGTSHSVIGLATSTDLKPNSWQDQGAVVQSGGDSHVAFNTIDPCIFEDEHGQPWLSFGSYFDGIKLVKIDPATGKRADDQIYSIATRPDTEHNPIEASAVYYHDGFYYLFVNFDSCGKGAKSTYNIRVGRSKMVTGPYLDKSGKDMMQGGGSLFVNTIYDDGSGRPVGDEVAPGHVGILKEGDKYFVSTHYEWARDKGGKTTMNVNALGWDSDGWPRFVLDAGPWQMVSNVATHSAATIMANKATDQTSALQTQPYTAAKNQKWTLSYQGDGFYGLLSASNGQALSEAGASSAPGAKMELAPFAKADSQLWYLQQNEDGTYCLLSKSSGKTQALDLAGCSLADGADIQQWNINGLDCQKWSLRQY